MIRTLTAIEAQAAIDWAAAEGWNPGLSDLPCFLAQDRGLFLAVEQDGELHAVISATRYLAASGFIGFYIARPESRGQGHGMAVWQAAMKRLEGRLIGLDGVVAQQANYRKSGFHLAWNNIRFGGVVRDLPAPSGVFAPASAVPFATLSALDAMVFPAPRPGFLHCWLGAPGHASLALLRDGEAVGFGVIRPARQGHKIGPLVAENSADAQALLAALIDKAGASEVFLDVPEPNRAGVVLAESCGLKPVFETARMYTGPAPTLLPGRIFGITSFELG